MHRYRAIFITFLLAHYTYALEVTPNSACSSFCDDSARDKVGSPASSGTESSDLVCHDDEFEGSNSTVIGRKFTDCLTCELSSNRTDSHYQENDVFWALSNMKFTIVWCVFAYPQNPSITEVNARCGQVCSGSSSSAKTALVDDVLSSKVDTQYQYCEDGDEAFSKTADDCMKCLNEVPKAKILANFVKALNVACDQRPTPGEALKLNFDVFPAVSTLNFSTSTPSSVGTVTVTTSPAYPSTSSSAALAASSSSQALASTSAAASSSSQAVASVSAAAPSGNTQVAASASAAASAKNDVKVGVGVGVGLGGASLILAMTAIILFRRRSTHKREILDGEKHARGEADYLAAHGVPYNHNSNQQPQPEQEVRAAELSAPDYLPAEADGLGYLPEAGGPDWLAEADGRRLDPELASRFRG
ncbi:hypothetical protein MMC07_008066 [Pseudocyphellaria aurata]|nr:hypothetical protein [Pseudocyphellaria aurata]